ncbi:acetyl-CoA C-acetyltransferase [Streptomyces griseorubiginosus]|uniref:acetyl-CoA C-acetyltransferase n=1 Tax=Streptomyces griseorubiginosus TaxID=67304 RepID=UPI001AD7A2C6|nr:acetyl-CoA C-acetyltransferase [Streptomyces griseorubiginosus]MBO4252332.1 acetyl-CoA C-acetyltransferase [Streptomyces griseorubiginosus]
MTEAVIVAAARSAIGRARKGSLVDVRADDLAAEVIGKTLLAVPQVQPHDINDLYLGAWEQSGEQGENIARRVAVLSGWDHVPAASVNRGCGSSLETTRMAANAIRAGDGDVFVSAGVESVSRYAVETAVGAGVPVFHNPRFAEAEQRTKAGAATNAGWRDPREDGALPDIYVSMGQTAENVALAAQVSRRDQDEFAVLSQQRAIRALDDGVFTDEIVPVTLPDGGVFEIDECPRRGTSYDAVSGLKPVFRENGTVTAANSCPLNDGAAAVVVMSDARARDLGLDPLARIVSFGSCGLSPEIMGLGPVEASRRALANAGLTMGDIDLVEINEAFAAQVLASQRALGIDIDRLNVHGGAIALGHPFGMTGARITSTLLNALRRHDGRFGLETMCIGGGQGLAMVIERLR